MGGKKNEKVRTKPYPVSEKFATHSKLQTVTKVRFYLKKYKEKAPVGFSIIASLKSMGLIPRSDGTYRLGDKYQNL
jgi:hypothetical protein